MDIQKESILNGVELEGERCECLEDLDNGTHFKGERDVERCDTSVIATQKANSHNMLVLREFGFAGGVLCLGDEHNLCWEDGNSC